MEDNTLVKSSFSAPINAPIESVDIPILVVYAARVGVPTRVTGSQRLWCNHNAGRSAHVDQCRNSAE